MEAGESGFPPSPAELNSAVPIDLERLVLKLLHPDPAKGYRDAATLIQNLRLLSGRKALTPWPTPECFVGRKDELAPLIQSLEGSKRPRAIAITGEAGLGKSTVLRRLALEAGILGYRAISVRCYLESGVPFEPLRAIAGELIPAGVSGRSLRSRYRRLVAMP